MLIATKFPKTGHLSKIFCVQSKTERDVINSTIRLRLAGGTWKCGAVGGDKKKMEVELSEGVEADLSPKHIAIIMDGNRRWANNRGLPFQQGYRAGGKTIQQVARNCKKYGAKVLSLYFFSADNWIRRPKEEVEFVMNFLEELAASHIHELTKKDEMRVNIVGDRRQLPVLVQNAMQTAEEMSKGNKGFHLVVAANYSGRYDIIEATKKMAVKAKHGHLEVEDMDDTVLEQQLETNVIDGIPNPDLHAVVVGHHGIVLLR